eukprot:Tamp_03934.p1 GENE.Tamp_03934~~Tamp_03934.p1  ORF type:complete len:949 (+),score=122.03 Tamp_03934:154-2847(+)
MPDEHAGGDRSSPSGRLGVDVHSPADARSPPHRRVPDAYLSCDSFPSSVQHAASPERLASSRKRSSVQLKALMEQELVQHMDWKRRIFGIGPKLISLPASRLIHPGSPFAQFVVLISSLLLVYTAIATPFIVAFYWHLDSCNVLPTLTFDMFSDTFFIAEILLNFCVGVHHSGVYIDDWKQVAKTYAKGMLLFDLITSIPVSFLEYFNAQSCDDGGGGNGGDGKLRFVRIIKPLRLFKLLRVIKAMKLLELLDDVEQWLRLPPFMFRMVRVFGIVMYVVHIFTCGYWLIKLISNKDEEMVDWYSQYVVELGSQSPSDSKWSSEGVLGGNAVFHQYVLSMYFINTVFSTVGFGDIQAQNTEERIFSMFAMYVGTVVFGTLLSEVENAMSQLRRYTRAKSQALQQLRDFLRSRDVNAALEKKIVKWVDFDYGHKYDYFNQISALEALPSDYQLELLNVLQGEFFTSLALFQGITALSPLELQQFQSELFREMVPRTFNPLFTIVQSYQPADGFYMVMSGCIHAMDLNQKIIKTLRAGDHFGQFSLLGPLLEDPTEGNHSTVGLMFDADLSAQTHVMVMFLSAKRFVNTLKSYPDALKTELLANYDRLAEHQFQRLEPCDPLCTDQEQARESRIVESWENLVDKLLSRGLRPCGNALVRYVNKRAHMNHLTAVAADAQTINMAEREELERDGGVQSAGGGKSEAAEGGPGEGDVLRELGTLRERMTVMHEHLNFISTVVLQIAQAQGLRHIGAPSDNHSNGSRASAQWARPGVGSASEGEVGKRESRSWNSGPGLGGLNGEEVSGEVGTRGGVAVPSRLSVPQRGVWGGVHGGEGTQQDGLSGAETQTNSISGLPGKSGSLGVGTWSGGNLAGGGENQIYFRQDQLHLHPAAHLDGFGEA